jgi:mono/diheme cytochrome c family protein
MGLVRLEARPVEMKDAPKTERFEILRRPTVLHVKVRQELGEVSAARGFGEPARKPVTKGSGVVAVGRVAAFASSDALEQGEGNAGTNCIGCHQHGGTDLTPESILATLPHHGSTRVRNNFFTDYLWAIKGGQGEDLSSLVQAEVDYWDANDP